MGSMGYILDKPVRTITALTLAAGLVVAVFAYLWNGDATLGLALGLSMIASMTLATFIGVGAPILFKRIGIDPAIAAGPLVTTTCDVAGVSIYLIVAILVLA